LVGIIGGTGHMGRWFAERVFAPRGIPVEVASRRTKETLTPDELAAKADVLILSVPIAVVSEVAGKLGPKLKPEGLLCDLTSLKAAPLQAMLASTEKTEVIGTHPLFGPGAPSLSGQTVVLCPGRGERWLPWLSGLLEEGGARVIISSPERHDEMMGAVQGLTHMSTLAFGLALAASGLPLEELLSFATPNFKLKLVQCARLLREDPRLYSGIARGNPNVPALLALLSKSAADIQQAVGSRDDAALDALFEKARAYLGDGEESGRKLLEEFLLGSGQPFKPRK